VEVEIWKLGKHRMHAGFPGEAGKVKKGKMEVELQLR
jgi:hypothetical protein